jgi:hypothetical protein
VAVGTVVVALCVGPVVDRFGRAAPKLARIAPIGPRPLTSAEPVPRILGDESADQRKTIRLGRNTFKKRKKHFKMRISQIERRSCDRSSTSLSRKLNPRREVQCSVAVTFGVSHNFRICKSLGAMCAEESAHHARLLETYAGLSCSGRSQGLNVRLLPAA